jgi:hypothetical protein
MMKAINQHTSVSDASNSNNFKRDSDLPTNIFSEKSIEYFSHPNQLKRLTKDNHIEYLLNTIGNDLFFLSIYINKQSQNLYR